MATGLTDYEQLRQQIKERNAERLRQLGVTSTAEELTTAVAEITRTK